MSHQKQRLASFSLPLVSVILPVYNGTTYLSEAIESILRQSYGNFELIIIDDGSTDDSAVIISTYNDPRIRFYSQKNQGLAPTLNRGISLADGTYIARQDQDDVSLPQRFEKQVAFLESHLDYGMVGTWAEIWTENGPSGRVHQHPTDNPLLQLTLLFTNPFVHSSMMMCRSSMEAVGGYTSDPSRHPPEDYELWSRIAREYEIANIPESLLIYREVKGSMSRAADQQFWERVVTISSENIFHLLNKQCDLITARCAARLVHSIDNASEIPILTNITKMMRDIDYVMEQRYPQHRTQLRHLLKKYLALILYHHRSPCLYRTAGKILSLIRSAWFFRRKESL